MIKDKMIMTKLKRMLQHELITWRPPIPIKSSRYQTKLCKAISPNSVVVPTNSDWFEDKCAFRGIATAIIKL